MGGRKWYSLIDKVWAPKNLQAAAQHVLAKRGAAGVDGETCQMFARHQDAILAGLQHALATGTYQPQPVRRHYIPKGERGTRPLGIPAVRDRVVQQALRSVLEPIFEQEFLPCSYGFRPGRGAWHAAREIHRGLEAGYTWVVDADIQAYFDTINQERLQTLIARRISDGKVLQLLWRCLRAGVMEDGERRETVVGTPQGGVISPLLANIYLHELDLAMQAAGDAVRLVRYADDFVILARSREAAETALAQARMVLEGDLGLRLHPEKTRVVHYREEDFDFLGFTFHYAGKSGRHYVFPRQKAVQHFKQRLRALTRRTQPQTLEQVVQAIAPLVRGWGMYFAGCNAGLVFKVLDPWIRGRLRAFQVKRAAHGRAVDAWLTNRYLSGLGLVSLMDLRRQVRARGFTLKWATTVGEPDVGKPHIRFDEGTAPSGASYSTNIQKSWRVRPVPPVVPPTVRDRPS